MEAKIRDVDPLVRYYEKWGDCRACDIADYRKQVVHIRGNLNASVCIIGEAPGRQEDDLGEPFSGASGKILDQFLKEFGFSMHTVVLLNLVGCRPCNSPTGQTRDAAPHEIANCRPRVNQLLRIIRPSFVLCLGDKVGQVVAGDSKFPTVKRGTTIYKTYDPTWIAQGSFGEQWEKFEVAKKDWSAFRIAVSSSTEISGSLQI